VWPLFPQGQVYRTNPHHPGPPTRVRLRLVVEGEKEMAKDVGKG